MKAITETLEVSRSNQYEKMAERASVSTRKPVMSIIAS